MPSNRLATLFSISLVASATAANAQAETCDRDRLDIAYRDIQEAPVPTPLQVAQGKPVLLKGTVQGPGRSHSLALKAGVVLRIVESANDCVGVALKEPGGKLAVRMYDQRTVVYPVTQTGLHQLVLFGYSGAHGNNDFAVRLELGKPAMGPEEREAIGLLKGKYSWDLDKSPLALGALKRQVGASWAGFRNGFETMEAFEVSGGFLLGEGCEKGQCGSAGSFLAVDLSSGQVFAGRMSEVRGKKQVKVLVGSAEALPALIRQRYVQWSN
jgi:hypothetical protein